MFFNKPKKLSDLPAVEMIEKFAFAEFDYDEIRKWKGFEDLADSVINEDETCARQLLNELLSGYTEPRQRYVLHRLLAKHGLAHIFGNSTGEIYGVVLQVGLEAGKETLSLYPNREGWYINFTGKSLKLNPLSDAPELNRRIDSLFEIATPIARQFEVRNSYIPTVKTGGVRINFLTEKGITFTEREMSGIDRSSPTGLIFLLCTQILNILVNMSTK